MLYALMLLGMPFVVYGGEVGNFNAARPATQIQVTQKALDYAATVAIDELSKQIQVAVIPNQKGDANVVVGKVEYELHNMKVTRWSKPSSRISVNKGQGLAWVASNAGISLEGRWHYKYRWGFITIKDDGGFTASVNAVNFNIAVAMGVDAAGRPTIRTASCAARAGDVSFKLNGSIVSWLYNLFRKYAANKVKDALNGKMCEIITKTINVDAAKALATMKVEVPIDGIMLLDYRLTGNPVFDPTFMRTLHKGVVYLLRDRKEAPFPAPPMPAMDTSTRMVNLAVSEHVFNTLGHNLQRIPPGEKGALVKDFTKDDLPASSRDYLNTTCPILFPCVGNIIPVIGSKYPNQVINLRLQSTKDPRLTIQNGAVNGQFQGDVMFRVPDKEGKQISLLTANTTLSLSVSAGIRDGKLTGRVNGFRLTLGVTQSILGQIDASWIANVMNFVTEIFIIPKLNEIGWKGIDIPTMDSIRFVDPRISLKDTAIIVSTDLLYQP